MLREDRTAPTIYPLSNVRLHVLDSIRDHSLKWMLDLGLRVTANDYYYTS
jgi:adenosine deaminase